MNRDSHFLPNGDLGNAAIQLGRFWDAVVDDAATPDVAPELADFAAVVRRLHTEPRDPAPESVHDGVRALIEANPSWWHQPSSIALTVDPNLIPPNGQAPMTEEAEAELAQRPTPIRRLWPVVELVVIAATILLLLYFAFGRDQKANPPTPTIVPTAVATATSAPTTPTAVQGAVGDWPMVGGGPSRSAGSDRQIPAVVPTERWNVTLSPNVRGVVAAGDKLYVTDGGTLYALDITSGAERWRFDLGVQPSLIGASPPAVVSGVAYVGANDGIVFAVDADTGHEVWEHETGGTITTAVAVGDGLVYVGTTVNTTDGSLFALDTTTGEQRWQAVTGPIAYSSPVIADGAVFVGGGGNTLFSFDAVSGAQRWKRALSAGMKSVAVGDGIAVAGSRSTGAFVNLVALDAATAKSRWQVGITTELPPAIVSGTVYVADDGGTVMALVSNTGAQRWRFSASTKVVDMAVVSDTLLLARGEGTVIAIAAANGKEGWRLATGGNATGIAVGASVVYVAHKDGTVAAYG